MRQYSRSVQAKEIKSEEQVKIVKHSSELSVELPTLETTDSIDRHIGDSSLAQSVNATPKRCLGGKRVANIDGVGGSVVTGKNSKDLVCGQCGDASNLSESYSSSLVNSVERTTAPSSIVASSSRHDVCYNSNSSPGTNFQTPCGRNAKRRNISSEFFEDMQNKERGGKFGNLSLVGSSNTLGTPGMVVPNGINNQNQANGYVLLSAVLQVIASIQKMRSGGQSKASALSSTKASGNAVMSGTVTNGSGCVAGNNAVNAAAQILGSKLPGVHPTTAALALAYSLSVAVASTKKMAGGGGVGASEDIIQSLSQLVSERTSFGGGGSVSAGGPESAEGFKITNELLQNIVSYLNSVVSHSSSQGGEAGVGEVVHQKRDPDHLLSPAKVNELRHESSHCSYNLKLPPMDFILNDKPAMHGSGGFWKAGSGPDAENFNYLNASDPSEMEVPIRHHRFSHSLELGTVRLESGCGIEDSSGQFEYARWERGGMEEEEAVMHRLAGAGGMASNYDIQTGAVYGGEVNGGGGDSRSRLLPSFTTVLAEISKCSEKKIMLESSGNYIWNDVSYNQVFDHVDFETPFSRTHAYLRNELVFCNEPVLEIDHEGGDYSLSLPGHLRIPTNSCQNHPLQVAESKSVVHPQHGYGIIGGGSYGLNSNSARQPPGLAPQVLLQPASNNTNDVYGQQRYSNPKIQSFCDDLLINSNSGIKNSQIFNCINYLMQLVGSNGANSNGNLHSGN